MSKFVISPHFRLQEWVAEEKGYFKAEGLDYEFRDNYGPGDVGKKHATPDRIGAFQSIEQGRACDVSGACHWTVNVAASTGHGKLYADAYSVAPCGVFVPPESDIKHPSDLKGVPISVGYQSGSHYSTIQGLEQYMGLDDIRLSFADGLLFSRLEKLIDRKGPAASLFSGPYYFLEQLGFRKVIHHLHDGDVHFGKSRAGRPAQVFPGAAARAARHRSASGALHALLQERISRALPRPDGHAALGPGRAHRLRALHQGSVRRVLQVDRRARHLRRGRHGRGQVRGFGDFSGGLGWLEVNPEGLRGLRAPDVEGVFRRVVGRLPARVRRDVIDVAEVLGEAVPGIADVVEEVRADDVPAESPAVLVALVEQPAGAHADLVHVAHLEARVVESLPVGFDVAEDVVVAAALPAHEGDDVLRAVREL